MQEENTEGIIYKFPYGEPWLVSFFCFWGMSNNPVSAALKYDAACRKFFGQDTWTNFPENTLVETVLSGKIKPKLLIEHEAQQLEVTLCPT